jgi:hypothetical protein
MEYDAQSASSKKKYDVHIVNILKQEGMVR